MMKVETNRLIKKKTDHIHILKIKKIELKLEILQEERLIHIWELCYKYTKNPSNQEYLH